MTEQAYTRMVKHFRHQEIMSEGVNAADAWKTCLDNPYENQEDFEAWVMGWEYYHIKYTGTSIIERGKQRWRDVCEMRRKAA